MDKQTSREKHTDILPQLDARIDRFFGRQQDVDKLVMMLREPDYRLITLVGPGGIGKTRLALQIADEVQPYFANGVCIVSLQAVSSIEHLSQTVLEEMGYQLHTSDEPQDQLLRYLKDQQLLLVLDNFEHLVDEALYLYNILETAPRVKILLTSREVLNLSHEWAWPVVGLSFPATGDDVDVEQSAAVQMFIDCAQHILPNFQPKDELEHVVRICQLVEGVPLAIKLAASLLRSLPCARLAEEIAKDFQILSTRLRDIPDQHRSMRVVFDNSWMCLTDEEKRALKRLAVFPGTFNWEAARQITEASIEILTELIDKSLINYDVTRGRYHLHVLLRQYVYQKLEEVPEELKHVRKAFVDFYRGFLAHFSEDIIGEKQHIVKSAVIAEMDNIRACWHSILHTENTDIVRRALSVFRHVCQYKGYYNESVKLLSFCLAQLEAENRDITDKKYLALIAETQVSLAHGFIRLGDIDRAEQMLQRAFELVEQHRLILLPGIASDPRISLGVVRLLQGRADEAIRLSNSAALFARARSDAGNLSIALYVAATAAIVVGNYDHASEYIREALEVAQQSGNHLMIAYCLVRQGDIARLRGEDESAQRYYEKSFEVREAFDIAEGLVEPLFYLGQIALSRADFARALRFFQECSDITRKIGNKQWLIKSLEGLGNTHAALGDYAQSHSCLNEALQSFVPDELVSDQLRILAMIGKFFLETGSPEEGMELLNLARSHPSSEQETKDMADETIRNYFSTRPNSDLTLALSQGEWTDIAAAVEHLQRMFPSYTWDMTAQVQPDRSKQSLVEPLTDRELEVLRLLSEGLSNQEIADRLVVVIGTVKTHNNSIFSKLGVKNRVQAVRRAQELKLL